MSANDGRSGRGDDVRVRLPGVVVASLGVLLVAVHLFPTSGVDGLLPVLVVRVLPFVLAVVLVGIGVGTARGALVSERYTERFALWIAGGMALFLSPGIWMVVLGVYFGRSTPYLFSITMNSVTLGGVTGAIVGLYDVRIRDQRRQLERRQADLQRQNERLDRFASVVSHDLRNPINVLEMSLEVAQETGEREHFDRCYGALDRMKALIDDMLTLAREGEAVDDTEPVSLAAVAEDCRESVDMGEADLRVRTDREIVADPGRLRQLLENLLRNAVEHGSTSSRPEADDAGRASSSEPSVADAPEDSVEHGSTSPDSRARQDSVEHDEADLTVTVGDLGDGFYVEDDGAGIPEGERDAVFDLGYTLSDDGTGFGLAIVDEIAAGHGWEVSVTESEEGGARFEVTGVDVAR